MNPEYKQVESISIPKGTTIAISFIVDHLASKEINSPVRLKYHAKSNEDIDNKKISVNDRVISIVSKCEMTIQVFCHENYNYRYSSKVISFYK